MNSAYDLQFCQLLSCIKHVVHIAVTQIEFQHHSAVGLLQLLVNTGRHDLMSRVEKFLTKFAMASDYSQFLCTSLALLVFISSEVIFTCFIEKMDQLITEQNV